MLKKITFFVTATLTALMFLADTNALGVFPYAIALFLMYQEVYAGKNRTIAVVTIGIVMAILNLLFLGEGGIYDFFVWAGIAVGFLIEE